MTWVATDNFDSYSAGSTLNGDSGGSGWTGNWTVTGGTVTTETAPAGGQGGIAARVSSATGYANRVYSGISAGTCRFRMQVSTTTPTDFTGIILDSKCYVRFGNNGQIQRYNGTTLSYENIQAYSANTWYTIDIDFDDATQPDKYRVRVDGGTYTSWAGTNGAYTTLTNFAINVDGTTYTFWVDDIKDANAPVTTTTHFLSTLGVGT